MPHKQRRPIRRILHNLDDPLPRRLATFSPLRHGLDAVRAQHGGDDGHELDLRELFPRAHARTVGPGDEAALDGGRLDGFLFFLFSSLLGVAALLLDPARGVPQERIGAPVVRVGLQGDDVGEDVGVGGDGGGEVVVGGGDGEELWRRAGGFGDGEDGRVEAEGFVLILVSFVE